MPPQPPWAHPPKAGRLGLELDAWQPTSLHRNKTSSPDDPSAEVLSWGYLLGDGARGEGKHTAAGWRCRHRPMAAARRRYRAQ